MRNLYVGTTDFQALAAEIIGRGNTLRFRARGGSMRPFIRDGDVLEVWPVDAAAIRRGDVVLCRAEGGRVVAHRVIHVSRGNGRLLLRTRGDALACPDGLVSQEQVLGRVTALRRGTRCVGLERGLHRVMSVVWIRLLPFVVWRHRASALLRRCL